MGWKKDDKKREPILGADYDPPVEEFKEAVMKEVKEQIKDDVDKLKESNERLEKKIIEDAKRLGEEPTSPCPHCGGDCYSKNDGGKCREFFYTDKDCLTCGEEMDELKLGSYSCAVCDRGFPPKDELMFMTMIQEDTIAMIKAKKLSEEAGIDIATAANIIEEGLEGLNADYVDTDSAYVIIDNKGWPKISEEGKRRIQKFHDRYMARPPMGAPEAAADETKDVVDAQNEMLMQMSERNTFKGVYESISDTNFKIEAAKRLDERVRSFVVVEEQQIMFQLDGHPDVTFVVAVEPGERSFDKALKKLQDAIFGLMRE